MNNQRLFDKYHDGNHWESHPTSYAGDFIRFVMNHPLPVELSAVQFVDLGCGNGRDVNFFNECFLSAIGFDYNEECIRKAKTDYPKIKSDFYLQNIECLPFEDFSQFAYFCINVMHYVDQKKVLGEIYRTLGPGGYAFIHFNLLIVDQDYSIDYHQKKSDVYELIKDFEIVEEKIFLREDALPTPHTHHIMQVILKKN